MPFDALLETRNTDRAPGITLLLEKVREGVAKAWIQGDYNGVGEEHCLVGWVRTAVWRRLVYERLNPMAPFGTEHRVYEVMRDKLVTHLYEVLPEEWQQASGKNNDCRTPRTERMCVERYNDRPETTQADILALLDKAILRAGEDR